mgnify:CR=1 FL=1
MTESLRTVDRRWFLRTGAAAAGAGLALGQGLSSVLAADAKANCPVSKALAVTITLDARLA